MIRKPLCVEVCVAICLLVMTVTLPAHAQDWSSFTSAAITGVTLTPSFVDGTTTYQLTLSQGATIDGQRINWIQAFYAVGGTSTTSFTATNRSNSAGWAFDTKHNSTGEIAGWKGDGNDRLVTPTTIGGSTSATFKFGTLKLASGSSLNPGFHLGYGDNMSGYYTRKVPLKALPEVAGLLVVGLGFVLTVGTSFLRRRVEIRATRQAPFVSQLQS